VVDLDIKVVPQHDKRLGRQQVHDPRSRRFAVSTPIDRSTWRTKSVRVYDPPVNPTQCHGECTGTTKCMQFNAAGNRINGIVLGMDKAHELYTAASHNDPWDLAWPPYDTGSSGLASCVAAQMLGIGGEYTHIFTGADGVVQSIMDGNAVSVGTWWTEGMMQHRQYLIEPTGETIGGHQYLARAYNLEADLVLIRCWWGKYRDVWIRRRHLNELILDGGDAHLQARKV
jgi:hypothetical protein